MSLEEELVTQILKGGKTEADVRETCKSLVANGILSLSLGKIDVALKRYELVQKYSSQDNSRRTVRKRTENQFGLIEKKLIENFMEDSSTTKVWLTKKRTIYRCPICNETKLREYFINYKKLKEVNNILVPTCKRVSECITFCFNCGTYAPNQTPQP
jgi:hypothetical protein